MSSDRQGEVFYLCISQSAWVLEINQSGEAVPFQEKPAFGAELKIARKLS